MPRTYTGYCHCRALQVEHTSTVPPEAAEVRECQCSFCRQHAAQTVSDPNGSIRFTELSKGSLHRYRFALKTADFLVCANCGVYMGCVLGDGGDSFGIVNVRTLDDKALFTGTPTAAVYDAEDKYQRVERRRARWTPATITMK